MKGNNHACVPYYSNYTIYTLIESLKERLCHGDIKCC